MLGDGTSILAYCLFAIAICTTILRLITRAYLLRNLDTDDYLMVIAAVVGCVFLPFHHNVLEGSLRFLRQVVQNGSAPTTGPSILALKFLERTLKDQFIASILYLMQFSLIKLSILAFYLRFMPSGRTRGAIYVVGLCVALFAAASCLASILQCQPISAAWSSRAGNAHCGVNALALQLAHTSFNLLTDVIILLLPIPIVIKLKASVGSKVGLVIIFSIGIAGTAVTAYRMSMVINQFAQPRTNPAIWMDKIINLVLWSHIEVDIATLCANLPALAGFWRTVRARRKTCTATVSASGRGPLGNTYELRPYRQGGVNSATATADPLQRDHFSASQENIIPKENGIVRSTRVDVSVH